MATTENFHTGGSGVTTFGFSFPILQNSDLKVELDGVLKTENTSGTNNDYSISNTNVVFNSAPASGVDIHLYRVTDVDTVAPVFVSGSAIRAQDLNSIADKTFYSNQEQHQKVKTADVRDGSITTVKIKADNIVGSLIADDAIDSEHIAADSLDSEHYAPSSVDSAAIGASQVTTNELATDAVNESKILNGAVTVNKIGADAVNGSKIADNSIDSEHYVDGSIDTVHLADGAVNADKIAAGSITVSQLGSNSVLTAQVQDGQITSAKLHPDTVITSSEHAAATTNDTSFLTSAAADARFFNISTGDTIKDGDTFPDNDTTIATTAAINDRIIDLVDDVGGFVPIANETSFPAANPDVNNGAGTIVSIAALASAITTGSGVTTKTIANGAGTGNTVTITGLTASTTYPVGFGMLVETTSTLHTYSFHRLVPKATEVSTVAGISGNVTTVAGISANTTTVAGISSDVTTVAGIASDVTAVAGNNTNITAVKNNETNINAVQSNASNINTVAGSIANVNNVGGSIASVNSAASNLTAINKYGDQYQVASSNPSADGGGNDLAEGDLYFNTTANELKVYDGSGWVSGVTQTGNFALTTGNSFSGDNTYVDNAKARFGTGQDLEIFHNTTDSIINDTGDGTLKVQTGGNTKLEIQSGGVGVTGNITVSGNVDGRDLAVDGAKLDNIEASATADQTAAEIRTLVESATDSNVFTDADHSKLNAIEPSATADQTDAEIRAAVEAASDSNVFTDADHTKLNGITTSATANPNALDNVVEDTTPQLGGDLDSNGNNIKITDGEELRLGDGSDLKLYHNGTNDFIQSNGGYLKIQTDSLKIHDRSDDHPMIEAVNDGAVKLYHDNSKTFETTSSGNKATGKLGIDDGDGSSGSYLTLGTSDDLKIYHDGTDNFITTSNGHLNIYGDGSNETHIKGIYNKESIKVIPNGGVELYHDNVKQVETSAAGVELLGHTTIADDKHIRVGTGFDMHLMHSNSANENRISTAQTLRITNSGFTKNSARFIPDGAVELHHDNSKKIETTSGGVEVFGELQMDDANSHIKVPDNARIDIGTGNDLQLYHDGNNSNINDAGSGYLAIRSNNIRFENPAANQAMLYITENGSVDLYHANDKKLETTSKGVKVTGGCEGNTTDYLAVNGAFTPDFGASAYFLITMNANLTINAPTNQAVGQSGSIFLTQDGTGSRVPSFNSAFKWAGGTVPTFTTTANKVDRVDYVVKASGEVHAVASLLVGG